MVSSQNIHDKRKNGELKIHITSLLKRQQELIFSWLLNLENPIFLTFFTLIKIQQLQSLFSCVTSFLT